MCHCGKVSSTPAPAEAYAAARDRAARPRLAEFAGTLPFTLDGFQRAACSALEDGHGVLVCAPTGAGKTVVGEFAVLAPAPRPPPTPARCTPPFVRRHSPTPTQR